MPFTNRRHSRRAMLALFLTIPPCTYAAAPQLARLLGGGNTQFQLLKDPEGRFTLEYPKKDWHVVPGGGSVLFTLARSNNEAAVVIEYQRLDPPLLPEEITERFSELEIDQLKERQPGASELRPGLMMGSEGRQSQIDYFRPGVSGRERVRLVTMPRGAHLYRIICSAKTAHFPKYEAIFSHIVETFRTKPTATAPQPAAAESAKAPPERSPTAAAVKQPEGETTNSLSIEAFSATPPVKIHDVRPRVPPSWGGAERSAKAVLKVLISIDGTTRVDQVVSSTDHDFLRECVDAVKQWRYTPAKRNDVPVAIIATLTCQTGPGK